MREVMREILGSYRVAVETLAIVAVLVVIRAVLWSVGVTGMSVSPLASSIIGGEIFVMGLVIAGTLADLTTVMPSEHRQTWRPVSTPFYVKQSPCTGSGGSLTWTPSASV